GGLFFSCRARGGGALALCPAAGGGRQRRGRAARGPASRGGRRASHRGSAAARIGAARCFGELAWVSFCAGIGSGASGVPAGRRQASKPTAVSTGTPEAPGPYLVPLANHHAPPPAVHDA